MGSQHPLLVAFPLAASPPDVRCAHSEEFQARCSEEKPIRRLFILLSPENYLPPDHSINLSIAQSVGLYPSIYLSTHLSISIYSSTCLSFLTFFLIINLFYSCFSLPAPVSLPLSFHNPVCIYVCFYMRAPPIFLAAFITSRVLFCPCGLVSLPYHYHRTVPCHANHYGCLRHSRRSPPYPSPARRVLCSGDGDPSFGRVDRGLGL